MPFPKKKYFQCEYVFVVLAVVFGLLFVALSPPFEVPDSQAHYWRAYSIGEGALFMGKTAQDVPEHIMYVPYFYKFHESLPGYRKILYHLLTDFNTSTKIVTVQNNAAIYNPIPYLLSGIVLKAASVVGLPDLLGFYLAVLANFVFWIGCVFYAIRMLPALKVELAFLALLPMSLYQGASLSADSFVNATSFLLFALVFAMLYAREAASQKELLLASLLAVLIACSKQIYALPYLLLLFSRDKKGDFYKIFFLTLILAVALPAVWLHFNAVPKGRLDFYASLETIKAHLSYLYRIPYETLKVMSLYYFETFVGVLGPLTVYLPRWLYVMYGLMFCCLFALGCHGDAKLDHARWIKMTALFLFVLQLFILILLLYLTWNHYKLISIGVQGRYFIPFFALLFVVFLKKRRVSRSALTLTAAAAALVAVVGLSTTAHALYAKYRIFNVVTEQPAGGRAFGELSRSRSLRQTFTAAGHRIREIRLLLATFARTNAGEGVVRLVDKDNRTLYEERFALASLVDNAWKTFSCDVPVVPGDAYAIVLESPTAEKGNAITWWASPADAYPGGAAVVDGRVLQNDFAFAIVAD